MSPALETANVISLATIGPEVMSPGHSHMLKARGDITGLLLLQVQSDFTGLLQVGLLLLLVLEGSSILS
jgi:hypothetical protein